MERCPVCNARYSGKQNCHRCKADIGKLADIEDAADVYQKKALEAYYAADYPLMLDHARRACSLRKTPDGIWLMACAAMLTRHFDLAMRLYDTLSSVSLNRHPADSR
jgi:hypothetical protein